jgi:hypothetical protein
VNGNHVVDAVYDSGSNVSLVNFDLIKKLKARIFGCQRIFKTLGGTDFTGNRTKLRSRINEVDEELDVYVIRNNNFSYDLLLGLDAIRKFRLIQNEKLDIFQRIDDNTIEKLGEMDREAGRKEEIRIVESSLRREMKVFVNDYEKVDLSRGHGQELSSRNKADGGSIRVQEALPLHHSGSA